MTTCEEKFPGGNVCGRERPCLTHEYPDQREGSLRRERENLREVIRRVRRDVAYALAAVDPHDWRKGLEIIATNLDEWDQR